MELDIQAVRENVRKAATEDLLDRATVYRAGMEPEALAVILAELEARGLGHADLVDHATDRDTVLVEDGVALRCTLCDRPAVREALGWHKLWDRIPIFPRQMRYCETHDPAGRGDSDRHTE